jgi:CIC family chloride channel protein
MSLTTRLLAIQRVVSSRLTARASQLLQYTPRLGADENTLLLGFAVLIGSAVGLAVIVFYELIDLVQSGSLAAVGRIPTGLGSLAIVMVVIAGLGLIRFVVYYATGDSEGDNIPDVMRAVAKRGGQIPAWPVAVKTAATAVAIGTAGSVGAEGPVAVAGSALGSNIGRFFRSGPERLRLLVACGAAAGISAAFNAPIAGVFFSLEKVIGSFGVSAFPPVLVASVIAAAISRAAFGNSPVIEIPTEYGVGSPSDLLLYALLGVFTGVVSVMYTRGLYWAQDVFNRFKTWHAVIIAGLIVGGMNVLFKSDLWGRGHETLSFETISNAAPAMLIGLAFAKLITTGVTVAATRVGGVFTPALFIGATLGGGLGGAAAELLPGFVIVPEAFALVGMAGLVAGSTHAPLTAIMIVFEMTGDYALILPLMLCGATAYIAARRIHPESIYSEWLRRRGETIRLGRDTAVLERLTVRDAYNANPHVIGQTANVKQILQAIGQSRQTEFPVVDRNLKLVGMLTYDDLRAVLSDPTTYTSLVLADDLASQEFERVTPRDSLHTALQRLSIRGSHYIPVVDDHDPDRLLGVIGRQEIFTAYDRELLKEH